MRTWLTNVKLYVKYMKSPKGRYEWRSFGWAIFLWIIISLVAIVGVRIVMSL